MESVEVSQKSITVLSEYASIPIAFEVSQVFDVSERADGFTLSERTLDQSYVKDYDAIVQETPLYWANHFNLSEWGLFVATCEGRLAGGATVAFNTVGIDMLEGRNDLAVLWDIRVAPIFRGRGVGSALFQAVETWARAKACQQLKIETQNINVPACKFYSRHGCTLVAIDRRAYPDFPHETKFLWYKDLS